MDREHDPIVELDDEGQSRRQFIRKAGVVAGATAWAVPTMQVLNMASAAAGVEGSVVPTEPPHGGCTGGFKYIKMEAIYVCNDRPVANDGDDNGCDEGYWRWVILDRRGCITEYDHLVNPAERQLPVYISEGSDQYHVEIAHRLRHCKIVKAKAPVGDRCLQGHIGGQGQYAVFGEAQPDGDENGNGRPPRLYRVEILLKCCVDHMPKMEA